MAKSNLFLKAKLTDRTSNAEDTLRVLCEYTGAVDTPATPVTIDSLNPANNFTFLIGTTNIIRYIPDSSIATQSGTSLSLDLGSGNTLEILGITFPEVASAPVIPSPASKVLIYGGKNIGSLSYDPSVIGDGSSLVFSVQYNGDPSNITKTTGPLPLITIAWGKNGNYII